jgi:hypothetical protein
LPNIGAQLTAPWRHFTDAACNISTLILKVHFMGLETPVAFAPFFDQFADRLNHQYKLAFLANADKKPTYRHVRLETEVPNTELVTPNRVYVPAAK